MAQQNTKDAIRKVHKTTGDVTRSAPLLQITKAIGDVGERVVEHTPEPVRKVGRQLRREAKEALEALPGLARRISRGIRKATKTTRKTSRRRRSNGSRR